MSWNLFIETSDSCDKHNDTLFIFPIVIRWLLRDTDYERSYFCLLHLFESDVLK